MGPTDSAMLLPVVRAPCSSPCLSHEHFEGDRSHVAHSQPPIGF